MESGKKSRVADPAFLGLLRSVADSPGDDTPVLVAADWLGEHHEPEPIPDGFAGRVPGWFTRCRRAGSVGSGLGVAGLGNLCVDGDHLHPFDHWGCAWVRGAFCLVSEPYVRDGQLSEVIRALRFVAARCDGVGVFSRSSAWNPPATWRLVWAPHPDRLPHLTRYDLSARVR